MMDGAQHAFLVMAIVVGVGSFMEILIVVLVRDGYRTTPQQRPHARRTWTLFAIGAEGLLCGGLCAILPPVLTGTWPHHPSLLYDAPLLTVLSVGGIGMVITASVPLDVGICAADVARLREASQQSHRLVMSKRDAAVRTGEYSIRGKALHFTTVLLLSLFPIFGLVTVNIIATLVLSSVTFLMSYVVAMVTLRRNLPSAGETLPT